jgi:hypothetical protein
VDDDGRIEVAHLVDFTLADLEAAKLIVAHRRATAA